MKKWMVILLVLLAGVSGCLAETEWNPEDYTREELLNMNAVLTAYLYDGQEESVLYDQHGIRIEFWGLSKDLSYLDMELFISNTTGEDLFVTLDDLLVNRCSVGVNHRWFDVAANSAYLASSAAGPEFQIAYLENYHITQVERLDFVLTIESDAFAEPLTVPLTVFVDYTLEAEEGK